MTKPGTKALAVFLAFLLAFQGGLGNSLSFAQSNGKAKNSKNGNRPPVLEPIPDYIFSTDLPVEFEIKARDPDGDPLTFTAEGLPPDAEFQDGIFRWFPQEIHVGEYEITFTVSDGKRKVSQTVFLYVIPGNLPAPQLDEILESIASKTPAPAPTTNGKTGAATTTGTAFVGTALGGPGTAGTSTGAGSTAGTGTGGIAIGNGVVTQGGFFPPPTSTTGVPPSPGPPPGPPPPPPPPTAELTFTFSDQTAALGVPSLLNTESVALGDLTGDGKIDLVVARPIGNYSLFANTGSGSFREMTLLDLGNAFAGGVVTVGDINNDSHLDIFIARNGNDFLLRNNGNGTFQDITAQAGVSSSASSVGALFADYDKDGFLDLFVVNNNQPSVLYRNQGNGSFQNVTAQAGIQISPSDEARAAVFFDADNDLDLDLYVVNYLRPNVLYINQGNGTFAASTQAGVGDAGPGVGAAVGDFNRDGFEDLFVVNDSGVASPFYQNNGNGSFTNIASQANLPALGLNPRGAILADFNNDAFLDLYIIRNGETNLLLGNDGQGKFVDKTQDSGASLPLTARQFAAGDLNEDGWVDLLVAGNPFTIHRNDSPKTQRFVQLRLTGTRSNRPGLGSRLELTTGSQRLVRYAREGVSNTKESLIQTYGLGSASSIDDFLIRWPSGTIQNIRSKVTLNQLNAIRENAAPVLAVTGPTTINEGAELTLNLQAQDPDNAGGVQNDRIILSVDSPPTNSTFRDNGDGTGSFTFRPDFTQSGQHTITFRATDGDLTDSRAILITVTNVSRAPTILPLQDHSVNEGQTLRFDIVGQDPDGDPLTFFISAPSPVPRNAGITVDPNNRNLAHFTFSPDFDQAAVYNFTFTVSDGGLTGSASSRITVVNVNRPPVLDPIPDRTLKEGENLSFTVSGSDPDNDPIAFSATGLPRNASFNANTRTFTFNPDFDQAGDYTIRFQVSDGNLTTERTMKITVEDAIPPGPRVPRLMDPGIANFSGRATLRWSDESASGATLYELQESNTLDFRNILRSFFPAGTSETITVTTSGAYFYRVRAFDRPPQNGGIASAFSNVVNLCVDLERNLDILNAFTNQGIIDGNPGASQSNRQIVNDPGGLGTLDSGNSIRFNYDLKNQSLAGLFFENNGVAANITNFKTVNLRVRGDAQAGFPVKLTIEMRKGGNFASLVLFFKLSDQYQDYSFPFFQRINEADTMTILVEGDTQGDGFGTLFVDEFFLSLKPYLPNEKPAITPNSGTALSDEGILDRTESQAAYYFYEQVLGPGHVKDADNKDFSSIAATGFGLTALTILANRYDRNSPNWNRLTPDQIRQRVEALLDDILRIQGLQAQDPNRYGTQGFLYHFIKADGTRHGSSEVSVVDQALLIAGVLTAGEHFGGSVKTKADQIYANTRWSFFLTANDRFRRSWTPEGGLAGVYDVFTDEILIVSLLAIGSDPNNLGFLKSFYSFPRDEGSYRGGTGEEFRFINSFFGSFFTYLYAHCWFDFENLGADRPDLVSGAGTNKRVNWWVNSIQGARSNRQFAIDRSPFFPFSYHDKSWGISAVQRPDEFYEGQYGAPPFSVGAHDGTVAVYAPLSSLPFFRTLASEPLGDNQGFQVLKFYYNNFFNELFGPYGPRDSLNNEGEFSARYLGIDLGPEVIMMENYRSRFIWDTFKKNEKIKKATEKIFGVPSGQDSFTLVVRNVSDNQPSTAGLIDFGLNPGGTAFATAKQYLDIGYNLSIPNAALCTYTDNRDYTGPGEGAGLIGQTDKAESVPMFWTAFDAVQLGGYVFNGDAQIEEIMQDRRRGDFLNPDTTRRRVVVDGNRTLMPAKPNRGQDTSPVNIYFGANFANGSAQTYKGTIVIEVCHIS